MVWIPGSVGAARRVWIPASVGAARVGETPPAPPSAPVPTTRRPTAVPVKTRRRDMGCADESAGGMAATWDSMNAISSALSPCGKVLHISGSSYQMDHESADGTRGVRVPQEHNLMARAWPRLGYRPCSAHRTRAEAAR